MICNVITGCTIIWTVLAGTLVSIGCSPESTAPKVAPNTCSGIIARYQLVVVTDAITDVVLVIVPAYLCWHLQMSVLLKLQVLVVFAFRLPLIALACLFLKFWARSLSTSNPGIDRSPAIILQQSQLCFSLIAGTIPCLKSFIRSFDTGSGVKAGFGSSSGYGSYSRTGSNALSNETYELSSVKHSKSDTSYTRSRVEDEGDIRVNLRPFPSARPSDSMTTRETSANNGYKRQHEPDRDSQGSRQELVIRKDMGWEVGSDTRRRSDTPGILILPQ